VDNSPAFSAVMSAGNCGRPKSQTRRRQSRPAPLTSTGLRGKLRNLQTIRSQQLAQIVLCDAANPATIKPATIWCGRRACTSKKRRKSGGVHGLGSGKKAAPVGMQPYAGSLKRLRSPGEQTRSAQPKSGSRAGHVTLSTNRREPGNTADYPRHQMPIIQSGANRL
jgi:hypothetical protein